MDNESLQEISKRDGEPTSTDGGSDGVSDSDGGGLSLPVPSLSRRQGLAVAVVAAVLVALYLSRRGDSGGGQSARQAKEEVAEAAKERSVEVENDETGERIELPTDPDEIIEMDAAIIESGIFSVVGEGGD